MTLREKVRDAMVSESLKRGHLGVQFACDYLADAAIRLVLEEAAKVAEELAEKLEWSGSQAARESANRIRSLGDKT